MKLNCEIQSILYNLCKDADKVRVVLVEEETNDRYYYDTNIESLNYFLESAEYSKWLYDPIGFPVIYDSETKKIEHWILEKCYE